MVLVQRGEDKEKITIRSEDSVAVCCERGGVPSRCLDGTAHEAERALLKYSKKRYDQLRKWTYTSRPPQSLGRWPEAAWRRHIVTKGRMASIIG
jgi:hypothetical protein